MTARLMLAGRPHGVDAASVDAWALGEIAALTAVAVAAALYAIALWASRARSPWPIARALSWFAGIACAALALGPVAQAAHDSFTVHMVGHLLLGMLAPLLLVLGAPVTLVLRALPVASARAVSRLLRSPIVRVLTHPIVAAVLNAGGLWLLYGTAVFALMHGSALVQALVQLHVFLAGYIFTASIVGTDPDAHRASIGMRTGVLLAFIAVHSMLAKWLYGRAPAGVDARDAQAGAQVMYYGGDVIDVTLLVLLGLAWYRATGRRPAATPAAV